MFLVFCQIMSRPLNSLGLRYLHSVYLLPVCKFVCKFGFHCQGRAIALLTVVKVVHISVLLTCCFGIGFTRARVV